MSEIHIRGTLDGQLDLLDRQIVSSDGLLIANVDDLELEERADGTLIVSGVLVGPGALGRRLGGALDFIIVNTWSRLTGRDPDDPQRIDYAHVSDIATVLTVDESREVIDIDGLETWARVRVIEALPGARDDRETSTPSTEPSRLGTGPAQAGDRHRFSQLAGMRVVFSDGRVGDQVTDVRFGRGEPRGHLPRLVTEGLVVGRHTAGTLFGYDRRRQQGPWLIQKILRLLHRSTGHVAWSDIRSIDWDDNVITLSTSELTRLDDL
ncbi:hypothetical protein GCM10022234_23360 [Aeromicrobium panaciterrae]|uniref:hypothetical protein n=1 Tax=Aeromicrobium panaciterrae TaxID=363861 RepID=UPI0031DB5187